MRSKLTIKTPEQIFNNPKICFQEWKQDRRLRSKPTNRIK